MASKFLFQRCHPLSLWCLQACAAILLMCLTGCSWLIQPPADHPPARRLIETAAGMNAGLHQYKGLAQAQLQAKGKFTQGRIALAAVAPNQMRVEWLSALGQPLTSLAGDGRHITILFHADRKIYRLPQLRTALERMVHIPIGVEDLFSILAGRPPLPSHTAAQIKPDDDQGPFVVLKNRWRGVVATLQMDRTNGRVKTLKVFDGAGTMQYQVQWRQWTLLAGYTIPKKVVIRSLDEQTLTLTVDRFWPNADVTPGTFVLSLPDNKA